jgi:hypothetical protein
MLSSTLASWRRGDGVRIAPVLEFCLSKLGRGANVALPTGRLAITKGMDTIHAYNLYEGAALEKHPIAD